MTTGGSAAQVRDSGEVSALWVRPRSRKCTWSSITPGGSHGPAGSMTCSPRGQVAAGGADAAALDAQVSLETAAFVGK
ncbi:MAG: hypothetical protein HOQ08_14315 [Frateuria sp.]|nr:hypothetical protein [Frateuria sp.]